MPSSSLVSLIAIPFLNAAERQETRTLLARAKGFVESRVQGYRSAD